RGRVTFRCNAPRIDERWDLEAAPPFAEWNRLYATGYWRTDALLGIGLAIGHWLDGTQQWLTRLTQATAPVILEIETGPHPSPIERAALDAPWELLARRDVTQDVAGNAEQEARRIDFLCRSGAEMPPGEASGRPTRDVATTEPTAISELLARLGPVDVRRASFLALDPGLLLTTVRRVGPAATLRPPSPYRLSIVFM